MRMKELLAPADLEDERTLGRRTAWVFGLSADFLRVASRELARLGTAKRAARFIDDLDPLFDLAVISLHLGEEPRSIVNKVRRQFPTMPESLLQLVRPYPCDGNALGALGRVAWRALERGMRSSACPSSVKARVIVTPRLDRNDTLTWLTTGEVEVRENQMRIDFHFNPIAELTLSKIMNAYSHIQGVGLHIAEQDLERNCTARLLSDELDSPMLFYLSRLSLIRASAELPAGWARLAGVWLERARAEDPYLLRDNDVARRFHVAMWRLEQLDQSAHRTLLFLFDRASKAERERLAKLVGPVDFLQIDPPAVSAISSQQHVRPMMRLLRALPRSEGGG